MFSDYIDTLNKEVAIALAQDKLDPKEILSKAESMEPLSLDEIGALIKVSKPEHRESVVHTAGKITRQVKGNDIGLIAPLYIDNSCDNACKYCGMNKNNTKMRRERIESVHQFSEEIRLLKEYGYRTVEIVSGGTHIDLKSVKDYFTIMEQFGIENIAFFFDTLLKHEYEFLCYNNPIIQYITMIHWQETYIRKKYHFYHPANTRKGNYEERLNAIETAILNGLKKYGIGILSA